MSFVHLRVRSGYSFMNSTVKINQLVQKAKQLNMSAVALTDYNVLHGAVEFYRTCQKAGIKPIIGMIATIELEQELNDILLIAKNQQGYQSLLRISSMIQINETKSLPFQQLTELLSHCFIILPTESKLISTYINSNQSAAIAAFRSHWPNQLYIGVGNSEQDKVSSLTHLEIPMLALGDVRYLEPEHDRAYQCIRAIDLKQTISALDQIQQNTSYLREQEEMVLTFSRYPSLIEETNRLAAQCQVELDFNQMKLPHFPLPKSESAHAYLAKLCQKALLEKYPDRSDVESRLSYELDTIKKMGFSDYFLIVWDFVRYAKQQDILVGPGRGSAAGSLVAYLLDITTIDPIQYDLLFERFLNPERVSMPDIDIDFSDHRREEVIAYVKEKYGRDHVAQIGTFGTFQTRSIIRELAKVFALPEQDLEFILKEIPHGSHSLVNSVKQSDALLEYIKQSEVLQQFFKVARELEGLPRNMSTHAAGVVIHDQKLTEIVPMTTDQAGEYLTQYAMGDLEHIGLLKMDFLGLRNLTTIERILNRIEHHQNKKLEPNQWPLNDQETFSLLQAGQTNGIFQLESAGMKRVLKQLKPTSFEDIVAVNALYRPGPMDFIETYIKRKHGKEPVHFLHPDLKPILSSTFGVLIYQEQIMQLAHKFAGLSYGQADLLRRAVSKKKRAEINRLQDIFIKGCTDNGYKQEIATELFSWIIRFADYGFNRSHAVAYSMISYQLAYLKAHYPLFFYTELLNTVTGNRDKTLLFLKEAKRHQINLLGPSINASHYRYKIEQTNIRMGLSLIKGVSFPAVKEILSARNDGPFKSLFDFCMRVSLKVVNRPIIERLILAGAFDQFGIERASLLATLDQAMEQGELFGGIDDQINLFSNGLHFTGDYQEVAPFNLIEKLGHEKELLGFYVSDHPLKVNRKMLRSHGVVSLDFIHNHPDQKSIHTAAVLQDLKSIRTKRGDSMAFVSLSDEESELDGVIFPELYRKVKSWLKTQAMLKLIGHSETRQGKVQLIINQLELLNLEQLESVQQNSKVIYIQLIEHKMEEALNRIKQVASLYPGSTPIIIYQPEINKAYRLSEHYYIREGYHALNQLKQDFGHEQVILKDASEAEQSNK
ncbi:DNA polymerase III subunit alpha [Amphibacillus sediminis]|uniref:DNA polymerase III subunit alpha n=1 Tax=Amphibacillus sediminis TaxID=360185 RepID=UPI00082CEC9C|nr:DNA polymerase III subunit alpha [Amphibacillus sediminis]